MMQSIQLGDIIQLRKGKKALEVHEHRINGSKPYIQIDEVRGVVPQKYASDPGGVVVGPDDLCIVWDGANAGTVGYGVDGLIGSTVARMRLKQPEEWDTRFIGRLLQSRFKELNDQAQARGATIPHVDKFKLESIALPRIKKPEQERIAAILDKADGIRRKRRSVLASVDDLIKSGFVARFGTPLSNSKRLPMAPIKQLGEVVTGNTPPRKDAENFGDALEWIKSDNINTPNHFLTKAEEYLSERGRRIGRTAPAGSTLVTCIAGSPSVIGNAAIADREVAFNQQINAVIPHDGTDPFFLYCQFIVGKALVQASSTNSMKGMVSKGKFQEIEFIRPNHYSQVEFGEQFSRIIELTRRLEADLSAAEEMFYSVSQRAFRGEL